MSGTNKAFDAITARSKAIFTQKMEDYGSAWRVLRTQSLTDQILIKAQRIRSLQEKEVRQVDEGITPEFYGILNYALMALIQIELTPTLNPDLSTSSALTLFDEKVQEARDLLEKKNHDYGEAWREMRIESIVDLILMKLQRIKNIEENKGETKASEGIDANFYDIVNYSIFALIKLGEGKSP